MWYKCAIETPLEVHVCWEGLEMEKKNPHAVALGRLGGLAGAGRGGKARAEALSSEERKAIAAKGGKSGGQKGGKARAKKMTKAQRSASARKAAQARWKK